ELTQCEVQVSSNPKTTACHGNDHQKLPKKVIPDLAAKAPSVQPDHTPYIEFLIPGHKASSGIERGVFDRADGLIYITAHYTKGSFVWLSGAPAALVADWQQKASRYVQALKLSG